MQVHFNSIKVRLKQDVQELTLRKPEFQFHKGTIETITMYHGIGKPHKFQFHKGTIETYQERTQRGEC